MHSTVEVTENAIQSSNPFISSSVAKSASKKNATIPVQLRSECRSFRIQNSGLFVSRNTCWQYPWSDLTEKQTCRFSHAAYDLGYQRGIRQETFSTACCSACSRRAKRVTRHHRSLKKKYGKGTCVYSVIQKIFCGSSKKSDDIKII